MNPYIETYCQVSFLESFFDSLPTHLSQEMFLKNEQLSKIAEETRDLLFHRCEMLIDDIEILNKKIDNPYFKKLIKESTSGGTSLIDYKKFFPDLLKYEENIKAVNPTSLHLYAKLDILLHSKLSLLLCDSINWPEKLKYFAYAESFNVEPDQDLNNFPGWDFLKDISLPINAAVLTDNYILKDASLFKNNLYKIIESLLPQKLPQENFHLSIITNIDLDKAQNRYQKINDFIQSLNKPFSVQFSIYLSQGNKLHDRDIITNYYRIHSGHSFNYYNNKGDVNKSTTLGFYALNSMDNNPHNLMLEGLKKITSNAKHGFDLFGESKNRLLS